MTDTAEARTIQLTIMTGTKLKESFEVPDGLHIMEDGENVPDDHFVFRILCQEKGDERLTWDSRSLRELQAAKQMFVDLIKSGLKPFRVGVNGKATSEVMDQFDPHAEEVIFLPQALITGG
jgi:hypothetical protein